MSGFTDTLKGLVSSAAPMIANTLLPGSGGLAKTLIGKVFGVDTADETAMIEAVKNATPDQIMALKQAEMTHEKELAQISAGLDKDYLKDRQNARGRDKALQLSGHHNYRADIMIIVAFIAFCLLCYLINSNDEIKPEVLAIFNMAIGALLKMLGDAFQFEFGSSRGSKLKDK